MNKPSSYDEAFWGTEFCSNAGYDALKKRLKEGRSTLKTVSEYLSRRQKAEDELAKAYTKAAKLSPDLQESGATLRTALDSMKDETEKMANTHNELSNLLSASCKRVVDCSVRLKNESKQKEDILEKCFKNKVSLYKSCIDAKKQYEKLSCEAELAEVTVAKAKPNQSSISTRDWEKLISTQTKSKAEAEKSHRAYDDAVRKLEAARLEWEREMTEYCKLCEKQDQERYTCLQAELWATMNATSVCAVHVDEQCENVRRKLEVIDCNGDMQLFISTSNTGTERPAQVRFEHYKPQLQQGNSSTSGTSSRENGAASVEKSGTLRLPHSPLEMSTTSPMATRVPGSSQPPQRSRDGPVQVVNRSYNR